MLVVGLIVFIGGLIFYLWKRHQWRKSIGSPHIADPINLSVEMEKLADQGAYREAFQTCFSFLLHTLAKQEKIVFGPTKTNGEYRKDLQLAQSRKAVGFSQLSKYFDRVWYGELEIDEKVYLAYRRQVFAFLGKGGHDEKN